MCKSDFLVFIRVWVSSMFRPNWRSSGGQALQCRFHEATAAAAGSHSGWYRAAVTHGSTFMILFNLSLVPVCGSICYLLLLHQMQPALRSTFLFYPNLYLIFFLCVQCVTKAFGANGVFATSCTSVCSSNQRPFVSRRKWTVLQNDVNIQFSFLDKISVQSLCAEYKFLSVNNLLITLKLTL
jgi:hypothetical protein